LINNKPASGRPWCQKDQHQLPFPTLRRLRPDDLENGHRLQMLFEQATAGGLVRPTEAQRLDFFAAAEHALRVAKRNSCGLFFAMIRGGWWHYISQEDEDRARVKLRRLDDDPHRFQPPIAA
jgi:hypothetical protein